MAASIDGPPQTIQFETGIGPERDALFTIDAHPARDIIATGAVTGQVNLYSYAPNAACTLLRSLDYPESPAACRPLKFSNKGDRLFCAKWNNDILSIDVETGQLLKHISSATSAPVYSMLTVSERVLVSGDEKGEIKIWDTRSWGKPPCVKETNDYISSMVVDDSKRTLLATCGDGRLYAVDMRQRTLEQKSDCNESELLSIAIVKGGKKVVCGDGEGSLMIYNWGLWGDITDRFPSHPESIDCLVALNDSVVCTACMDAQVRSVQILPNQTLGVVGRQSPTAISIDTMCLTHNREYLITSSQDCCRFWSLGEIPTLPSDDQSRKRKTKREIVEKDDHISSKKKRRKQKATSKADNSDFFGDL